MAFSPAFLTLILSLVTPTVARERATAEHARVWASFVGESTRWYAGTWKVALDDGLVLRGTAAYVSRDVLILSSPSMTCRVRSWVRDHGDCDGTLECDDPEVDSGDLALQLKGACPALGAPIRLATTLAPWRGSSHAPVGQLSLDLAPRAPSTADALRLFTDSYRGYPLADSLTAALTLALSASATSDDRFELLDVDVTAGHESATIRHTVEHVRPLGWDGEYVQWVQYRAIYDTTWSLASPVAAAPVGVPRLVSERTERCTARPTRSVPPIWGHHGCVAAAPSEITAP